MTYCKNCGDKVEEGERFCDKCGSAISVIDNEKQGEPIKKAPELTSINGIGTTIYKDTVYLIFLFIPVFALARYIVTNNKDGTYSFHSKLKLRHWQKIYNLSILILAVVISIIIAISSYSADISSTTSPSTSFPTTQDQQHVNIYSQDQIASSVVNILCEDGEETSRGSGTIISSDGLILTNAHIIPQDKDDNPTVNACYVVLPDSQGKAKEIYLGQPTIIPYLSSRYDIAFVSIYESFIDEDGVNYGEYPNTFPGFLETGCMNNSPRLGEPVRVFGYPTISGGGYFLTITDGVVSSLPNDGTIYISAKINHGSSGGLAVDENGCMLGIPSMISGDENESLGVLISNDVLFEFIEKSKSLEKLLE